MPYSSYDETMAEQAAMSKPKPCPNKPATQLPLALPASTNTITNVKKVISDTAGFSDSEWHEYMDQLMEQKLYQGRLDLEIAQVKTNEQRLKEFQERCLHRETRWGVMKINNCNFAGNICKNCEKMVSGMVNGQGNTVVEPL